MITYRAEPCPCGHSTCKHWHVSPVAAFQGVGFTEEQAQAVAALLNAMERREQPAPRVPGNYYAVYRAHAEGGTPQIVWFNGRTVEQHGVIDLHDPSQWIFYGPVVFPGMDS